MVRHPSGQGTLDKELVITLALLAIVVPEATTKQRAEAVVANIEAAVTVVAVLCITVADRIMFATGVLKETDDTGGLLLDLVSSVLLVAYQGSRLNLF